MSADPHHSELHIWQDLFPESSRTTVSAGTSLFRAGDPADRVYLIESGAVAELRTHDGMSHAICLCHAGMLVGVRWTGGPLSQHAVEAIALGSAVVRSMPQDRFVRATRDDGRYAGTLLADMAKRVESVRRLADCLAQSSARDHVLSVLRELAHEFGTDDGGRARIAVPAQLLQRLTGCPLAALGSAINDLMTSGIVRADARGLQLSTSVMPR
jgi:CRP-like cAMP-binding protein